MWKSEDAKKGTKKSSLCAYPYGNTKKQLIFAKGGKQGIREWGGVVTLIIALYSFMEHMEV